VGISRDWGDRGDRGDKGDKGDKEDRGDFSVEVLLVCSCIP
jgi:hypothetical protein